MTFDTAAVKAWLKITRADDDALFGVIVAAVVSLVDGLPDIDREASDPLTPDVPGAWTDSTVLGALMLAARLYTRRNSPNGVEAFTDGGATYVARYDPDVARLLHVDGFAKPRVG